MINKPHVEKDYEWSQYTDDVEHGLFTVKEIVKRDIAKVYSQGEAIALIGKLKKVDEVCK